MGPMGDEIVPIRRRGALRKASAVPFGVGSIKPRHYLEMARIVWENRGHWGYAWDVLNHGVCDGCALGTSGMRDWTIEGTHLCLVRLNLLRLNTMTGFDPALLADVSRLPERAPRAAEPGPHPLPVMRRRKGEPGLHARDLGRGPRRRGRAHPRHRARSLRLLHDLARPRQRGVLHVAEGRAPARLAPRRQRRAPLPQPVDRGA